MPAFRVEAAIQRTIGTSVVEADTLQHAHTIATRLQPADFDQADDNIIEITDIYPEA